jgi:hypothetical protein
VGHAHLQWLQPVEVSYCTCSSCPL